MKLPSLIFFLSYLLWKGNAFTSDHFQIKTTINRNDASSIHLKSSPRLKSWNNRLINLSSRDENKFKFHTESSGKSLTSLELITSLTGGETILSSSIQPGLIPAILSPLSSALGFMIWDNNWRGSAFALNFVKNVIATFFFFVVLFINKTLPTVFQSGVPYTPLAISAFLGVVIGDCTAIGALRRLGSRRYLLIDCLKPALSVLVGVMAFGEQLNKKSILGITSIVTGVYIASIQKLESSIDTNENKTNTEDEKRNVGIGYTLAVGHLIFDTIGAAITKKCMGGKTNLGPLSVGLIRFGAAAIMLQIIGRCAKLFHSIFKTSSSSNERKSLNYWWDFPETAQTPTSTKLQETENKFMTRGNWEAIAIGTFFVTFLGPSLFYRSLQFMSLGIGVTLSCTAPLYEPILARILKGTIVNGKAILGAILAFIGVATISL